MTRLSFRSRLSALEAAVRPWGGAAVRLAKLSQGQRDEWLRYRRRLAEWHQRYPDATAFEAYLKGSPMPQLRDDVAEIVHGRPPLITTLTTVGDAAAIFEQVKGQ